MWYDDNPKKAVAMRIAEAIQAYVDRFHSRPNVVLMNEAERIEVKGVTTRSEGYIRKNNYWVGRSDD
jgi:hypothetical protein